MRATRPLTCSLPARLRSAKARLMVLWSNSASQGLDRNWCETPSAFITDSVSAWPERISRMVSG
jgi:hypothetical protein